MKFIHEIEINWQDQAKRSILLFEFKKCLEYFGYKTEELTKLSLRQFLLVAVPMEREFGKDLEDKNFLVQKKDGNQKTSKKMPLILILDDLRSAFNVGSIFRSAECFAISKIYLCGYTPTPENDKVKKTAMGTEKKIEWEYKPSALALIEKLQSSQMKVFALETAEKAKILHSEYFPPNIAFMLGNEALGLSQEILQKADGVFRIPMRGWKNSLNVGMAAAICCYELDRQWRD